MSQPRVSLHGLANTEIPAVTDNQVCFASVFLRPLNTMSYYIVFIINRLV